MKRLFMRQKNQRSQIAVVITLIIGVIILFTIVFINLAKVSERKTLTSQTVDRAALYMASNIGGIASLLKSKEKSDWNYLWGTLFGVVLIIGGVALGHFGVTLPIAAIVVTFGVATMRDNIKSMQETWPHVADQMTRYNSLREETLQTMVLALSLGDGANVTRRAKTDIFEFKDTATNSITEYDLTKSPLLETLKKRKNKDTLPRYSAWYYAKRYPLVSEDGLGQKIKGFIDNLLKYVYITKWDANTWNVTDVSLVVGPNGGNVDVTCDSCPSWVFNAGQDLVTAVGISEDKKKFLGLGDYEPFGFLKEQFTQLLIKLDSLGGSYSYYDLSFCNPNLIFWTACGDVDNVIEDLKGFTVDTRDLLNKPVSSRIPDLTLWINDFYDMNYAHSASGGTHDVYDRLSRDQGYIETWIGELGSIDTEIKPWIYGDKGTHCGTGLGNVVSKCEVDWCCDCSDCECLVCCHPASCSWKGIYCSCSPSNVCTERDLYEHKPNSPQGCPLIDYTPGCTCACSTQFANDEHEKACRFQGDYNWANFAGPTEVRQAIEILKALKSDLDELKNIIQTFAQDVDTIINRNCELRNDLIYAWQDRPLPGESSGRSHVARAKLEGYPTNEHFPHLVQTREWGGMVKKLTLVDASGNFILSADTYAADIPTAWWNMRFRKNPAEKDFADKAKLAAIVSDIQTDGKADATKTDVDNLLSGYGISSASHGYYGPTKPEIYIEKVK
jgi:hypothetical protein